MRSDAVLPPPVKCTECGGTEFELRENSLLDTLKSFFGKPF